MAGETIPVLSKSRFTSGLQCLRKLYLSSFQPDLGTPPDASQQAVFDAGAAGKTIGTASAGTGGPRCTGSLRAAGWFHRPWRVLYANGVRSLRSAGTLLVVRCARKGGDSEWIGAPKGHRQSVLHFSSSGRLDPQTTHLPNNVTVRYPPNFDSNADSNLGG